MRKEATIEAMKNPRMNFGNLYQISPAPTLVPVFSTLVAKKTATKKAMKPIRMFWIDFTSTAAC